MKKLIYLLAFAFVASSVFVSCKKDDDSSPLRRIKLGAQENTSVGGFYSISNNKVYSLEEAAKNQAVIDFLCFYENTEGRENNITISSPGANIRDIFEGENSPEKWDVTDTTFFYQVESTALTLAQFDALKETDAVIETLYNEEEARRKAKDLQVGDVYSFNTEDNLYGLFKVVSVTQGKDGCVEIDYIIKK